MPIGKTILVNVLVVEHPSTYADSFNSIGISEKNSRIIRTKKGRLRVTYARIKTRCVSIKRGVLNVRKNGVTAVTGDNIR